MIVLRRVVSNRRWHCPRTTAPVGLALAAGVLFSLLLAPTTTVAATSAAGVAQAAHQTQTNTGGQVTVAVTWHGSIAEPTFTVVLDTHAVDLDRYDLRQLAVLRTDQGQEVQPSGWDAPPGGHHRQGTL